MTNSDDIAIDVDLVRRTTSGEVEVFGELMARYEKKLLRYVIYLIHDEALARDVVQDTFIKTYQNLRGYNPKYKFSSWIYRISHNEAMNAIKRHSREVGLDDINEPSHDSSVVQDIDREILNDDVNACLDELDERGREVLMLHYYEHMKYEEVADVLHVPTSTVGVWISRAKKRLKEICKRKGVKQ